jgi:hypothetical protein
VQAHSVQDLGPAHLPQQGNDSQRASRWKSLLQILFISSEHQLGLVTEI